MREWHSLKFCLVACRIRGFWCWIKRFEGCPLETKNIPPLSDKSGTMFPCNVVVQEVTADKTEGTVIDPVASLQAIDNPRLLEAAAPVQAMLRNVVENL